MNEWYAVKYCGGIWCGDGIFDSLEAAFEFADDGFCDYVRIVHRGRTIKMHFQPNDEKLELGASGSY